MINKRHLLPTAFDDQATGGDPKAEKTDKKFLSMGEDEELEPLTHDGIIQKTWWRNWLKMK